MQVADSVHFAPIVAKSTLHQLQTLCVYENSVKELVSISLEIEWYRFKSRESQWKWGDEKSLNIDPAWSKKNVIYRWVRDSDLAIAMIGETERTISQRVNNYQSGKKDGSAGRTNKRLYAEATKLEESNDFLYLEILTEIEGYNLNEKNERRQAESLLVGTIRPYLQ